MSQGSRIASVFIAGRRFGYAVAVVAAQFRVGCGCYGIGAMRGGGVVMLEEIEVLGEVTDKGFRFCDREHVTRVLRGFKRGPVVCRFKVYRDTRSNQANRYYRGVVLKLMAEDSDNSPDDIHDAMCERFLPNEQKHVKFFNRLTGEVLEVETDTRRSSKLSREEFYDFVERVRQFAAEWLHIETPDPDPSYWRRKKERTAA